MFEESQEVLFEVTWPSSRLRIEMEMDCSGCEKRKSSILSQTERVFTETRFYDVYNYSQFPPEGLKSNCSILNNFTLHKFRVFVLGWARTDKSLWNLSIGI